MVIPAGGHAQQVSGQPIAHFGFDDVVKRARDLASAPFEATPPPLPDVLAKLSFDAWRDIRFRRDKAFLGTNGGPFRLEMFHLGHLYPQPVTVNIVREGLATPVPYSSALFDYGRTKVEQPLPVNLGFAGFRLLYPLNRPDVLDEVVAFLGASYFRFLGRNQRYGISARGLAVGTGLPDEEFPFYREVWIETPDANADRVTIYALLDGAAATGAYRFDLYPGVDSVMEVSLTLYPRRSGSKLGFAPLTSMFFTSQNDRRIKGDFRPELHDSDGLLLHSSTGEWIWRPLRNPEAMETSVFLDKAVQGFGLLQRDRTFEDYQDLDLAYELRPSYWVEAKTGWGEGRVELVELPTTRNTTHSPAELRYSLPLMSAAAACASAAVPSVGLVSTAEAYCRASRVSSSGVSAWDTTSTPRLGPPMTTRTRASLSRPRLRYRPLA